MYWLYTYFERKIEFLETSLEIEGVQNLNVTLLFYHPEIDKLSTFVFLYFI